MKRKYFNAATALFDDVNWDDQWTLFVIVIFNPLSNRVVNWKIKDQLEALLLK